MLIQESQFITESVKENQFWYISGVFAQAETINNNKRIYAESILDREIAKFNTEKVSKKTALGELSHPQSPVINPDRVAILIEDISKDGSDYYGRAKVVRTPCGLIIESLLEAGTKIGVSTRGGGDMKKRSDGIFEVQENYKLFTIDAVLNPSAPKAMVEAVFENTELESILGDNMLFEEFYRFVEEKKKAKQISGEEERNKRVLALFEKAFRGLAK